MSSADVVSLYNEINAGVRARALTWFERAAAPYRLHSYFESGTAASQAFARSPVRAAVSERRLRSLAKARPEVLLLSREATPFGRGQLETRLLSKAHHGIYDIDDALHRDVRGRVFETFFSKAATAARAAEAADVVIAGNTYLADWASTLNSDVRVVPTCVEPDDYRSKSDYGLSDRLKLVWLGTPSGERYLADIGPALKRINTEFGARLTIVGSTETRLGELESLIDRVPWSLKYVHEQIGTYDIGLMPLRDTPYERGKCAYKLLEYGAAGLPSVASPVGANARVLTAASAPAPSTVDDWYRSLVGILTASDTGRMQLGHRLRETVADGFSFARHETTWRSAVLS